MVRGRGSRAFEGWSGAALALRRSIDSASSAPAAYSPRVSGRRRKHWGWGFEDQQPSVAQLRASAAVLAERVGLAPGEVREPVALDALLLAPPRVEVPPALSDICEQD